MGVSDYEAFLARKLTTAPPVGIQSEPVLHESIFDFQRDLVRWALRRGRAAIFASTGLGKTRMQVAWADNIACESGKPVLILAPLAVAPQTVEEAKAVGVRVKLCREQKDAEGAPIAITNYDRLHKFEADAFGAVVLDESSCIKHHDTKTLAYLLTAFRDTPYKLCCTATPAPNDWEELGTHAEFLGICTRSEMLSEFFVHDGGDTQTWRLKGHARAAFWRWVASWGALVQHPRDLGYDTKGYDLPPLRIHEHTIKADESEARAAGLLFVAEAGSLMERRQARRASIEKRVRACVERVAREKDSPWIVWCDLNAESEALAEAIPGAVEVTGSMDMDEKERRLADFSEGRARVLVSKSAICGWGMNWQHCCRMAFVGVTDSFEAYYQAIRRCWRFGQTQPVDVHIFASEAEGAVVANLKRKEANAAEMTKMLAAETAAMVRAEVRGATRERNSYEPRMRMTVPGWLGGAA